MKKHFIIILGMSIMVSCVHYGTNVDVLTDFVIENKSGKVVSIQGFLSNKLIDNILIENGGKFVKPTRQDPDRKGYTTSIFPVKDGSDYRDSVIIIFDNNRIINQTCGLEINSLGCDSVPKSLLKMREAENYRPLKFAKINPRKKTETTGPYVITLTPEDYARAVPLEDLKKK